MQQDLKSLIRTLTDKELKSMTVDQLRKRQKDMIDAYDSQKLEEWPFESLLVIQKELDKRNAKIQDLIDLRLIREASIIGLTRRASGEETTDGPQLKPSDIRKLFIEDGKDIVDIEKMLLLNSDMTKEEASDYVRDSLKSVEEDYDEGSYEEYGPFVRLQVKYGSSNDRQASRYSKFLKQLNSLYNIIKKYDEEGKKIPSELIDQIEDIRKEIDNQFFMSPSFSKAVSLLVKLITGTSSTERMKRGNLIRRARFFGVNDNDVTKGGYSVSEDGKFILCEPSLIEKISGQHIESTKESYVPIIQGIESKEAIIDLYFDPRSKMAKRIKIGNSAIEEDILDREQVCSIYKEYAEEFNEKIKKYFD